MPHKRFRRLNPTKSVRSSLTGLKLSAVLLLGLGLTGLQAQEAIPAAGGNASGSGGSVGYSVGQLFYTTNTGTTGSVAQGVQQPYEISVVSGIAEAAGIHLVVFSYPNPAIDFLILKIEGSTMLSFQSICYQLYDINGKLLMNKNIESNETFVSMINLVSGIYFLKVIEAQGTVTQKEIKTFKIIKN